jgi:hypothetical protein
LKFICHEDQLENELNDQEFLPDSPLEEFVDQGAELEQKLIEGIENVLGQAETEAKYLEGIDVEKYQTSLEIPEDLANHQTTQDNLSDMPSEISVKPKFRGSSLNRVVARNYQPRRYYGRNKKYI